VGFPNPEAKRLDAMNVLVYSITNPQSKHRAGCGWEEGVATLAAGLQIQDNLDPRRR